MTFGRISADPRRMGGLATVRDTRMTVTAVLGQLAAGQTPEQILLDYPYLECDDIYAALEHAATVTTDRYDGRPGGSPRSVARVAAVDGPTVA